MEQPPRPGFEFFAQNLLLRPSVHLYPDFSLYYSMHQPPSSMLIRFLLLLTIIIPQLGWGQSADLPTIPIGLDAYLQWDRLPYQRLGMRAYMRSTYDRLGNNYTADASHYLYQESDTFNVALDVKTPGVLYFVRTNHFHGSPWHYEVDGEDFLVKETSTDDPIDAKTRYKNTTFIPEELFPNPLTWTWAITKGADLMWVPIPFEQHFRLAYSRTYYGTGYYIYHAFPEGADYLSQPLTSWQQSPPDPKVLDLINQSGSDLAPSGEDVEVMQKTVGLKEHQTLELATLTGSPRTIRALEFSIPREQAYDFGKSRLRITWDRRWHASVDVPLDLFFGAGHLYNPEDKEYLVKGFPLSIRYSADSVFLSCYWPMPFFEHAVVELQERQGKSFDGIGFTLKTVPYTDDPKEVGYFHATYSDHPDPVLGQDMTFLDTRQVEGGGDWSGNFVGMSWIFSHEGVLRTLEGDPRFFFDDSRTPQAWGTGTEEWGGGGDYWGGLNMTLPLAGHPVGKEKKDAINDLDLINSAYRFLIADYFPFGKNAVINLEHGGQNSEDQHYEGIVYWYGSPFATLKLTDELNVFNAADARVHAYESPTAEPAYALTSRYEWGPDTDLWSWFVDGEDESKNISARQYYPAEQDSVCIMRGSSTFEVTLDFTNLGVMLRRKFDYQYPNQQATVWVRDAEADGEWQRAGTWYTAGSNTCYHSYPQGHAFTESELLPTNPKMITSNRRWREEEFLINHQLTRGVSKLAVKIEWVPVDKLLFPDQPFPVESAWSESRYWVYCYQLPDSGL
uniref:DUF2961 domain-containing protein n=1 Tax=Roseihalotalea indica TaxID=2867963 RepID=A0AA49GSD4_9BACT|nr:DUF2961 domain-containing protein [Tunicatimonas sp. TK19036]